MGLEEVKSIPAGAIHYLEQLMEGFALKAPFALFITFFTDFLFGDIVVLSIYMAFVFADLMLGIIRAAVYDTFSSRYLLYWTLKVSVNLLLVSVVGLLSHSLFRTSGLQFATVNWALFCCTFTEAASIIKNLRRLGCPVHPMFGRIMDGLRGLAASKLPDNGDFKMILETEQDVANEEVAHSRRDSHPDRDRLCNFMASDRESGAEEPGVVGKPGGHEETGQGDGALGSASKLHNGKSGE